MPYRGLRSAHIGNVNHALFAQVGVTATWRQWISSTTGNPDAGLGDTQYYREQIITATFSGVAVSVSEQQEQVGLIIGGTFRMVTDVYVGKDDELTWNGENYNVINEPYRAPYTNAWLTIIQRGY